MTDPEHRDSQAASGGRRNIPLVPHLVWLTEWDHRMHQTFPGYNDAMARALFCGNRRREPVLTTFIGDRV